MKKLAELTNKEIINLLSKQAHLELQSSFLYSRRTVIYVKLSINFSINQLKKVVSLINQYLIIKNQGELIRKSFRQRIQNEDFRLYLQYAYWFDNNNYEGIGKFFKAESEEERKHSVQIFDYLNVRGVQVTIDPQLAAFQNLKIQYEKPGDYFEAYLAREHLNYSLLDQIGKQAQQNEEVLTHKFIGSMLEDQASSVDEAEKLYAKAQAYSAFPGLFYSRNFLFYIHIFKFFVLQRNFNYF